MPTLPSPSPSNPLILGVHLTPRNFHHFVWGLQVVFWLLWVLLAYHSEPAQQSQHGPSLFVLTHVPLIMGAVYLNYFGLIPRWLARQQYGPYALALLALIMATHGLRWAIEVYVMQEASILLTRWPLSLGLSFILLIGSTLFKFVEGWFHVSQQQVKLQNEQLRSELNFLRAQVNPHFLFNTLNNLYTLTLTQDQRAPQMVAQLSELMRYLIYDSSTTRVKLLRELDLLRSYIELQQLQHDEAKNVDLYVEGVKNQHQIAPLLLITFLENSFKHGDLATNPHGWITVSAVVEEDGRLQMTIANSVRPTTTQSTVPAGIGLDNARRQLELNYPESHHLHVERREDEFRVELTIDLEPIRASEGTSQASGTMVGP